MKTFLLCVLLAVMIGCPTGCKESKDNVTVAENSPTIDRLPGISKPLR